MRLNGWDPWFEGWGGEDNEIGYRIVLNGMDIIYSEDAKAFHIWREITSQERYLRLNSVLRNIEYMCKKFPELANYERLIQRRKEVEELIAAVKSQPEGTALGSD
jgi:GT2 family glycosyltransferase